MKMIRVALLTILVGCFPIFVMGCGQSNKQASKSGDAAKLTERFWSQLCKIQKRENEEIKRLNEVNKKNTIAADLDKVAESFNKVAGKHRNVAKQLTSMDSTNVDQVAIDFRNRLAAAHQLVAEELTKQAKATTERDKQKLEDREPPLTAMKDYVTLWNSHSKILEELKSKHGKAFEEE